MRGRRTFTNILVVALLTPLVACNAQEKREGLPMKKEVALDVVVFNYLNHPIFEVLLNGRLDGGAAALDGGRAISVGVLIPLGPQTLTWRDAGSGKNFSVKNPLVLTADQIPANARYLAVHIYPDETAEFTFAPYLPEPTPKGKKIYEEAERNER
jgi:hypothetical protein